MLWALRGGLTFCHHSVDIFMEEKQFFEINDVKNNAFRSGKYTKLLHT